VKKKNTTIRESNQETPFRYWYFCN